MDDVLINKFASLEKCLHRVQEEYTAIDITKLKSIIEERLEDMRQFGQILISLT